jgi:ABC-2 type transport system permease protein
MLAVMRKEFIQMSRDRRTLSMVLIMPALLLVIFGYALNTVTDHLATVVYDESDTGASRAFADAFANSGYFDIRAEVSSRAAAMAAIDTGEADVALIIPPDFGDDLLRGQSTSVQMLVDGSNPNVAQTALFAGGLVGQAESEADIAAAAARLGQNATSGGIDLRPVVLYNPSMLNVAFMVPGLIGMILQMQAILLTAFAIVRERERGTLEQLVVTPVRSAELMLGKVVPYVVVAFAAVAASLAVGHWLFQVPIAGSLGLLFLLSLPFLLGSLGIGLLISVLARTQSEAQQLAQFTTLPAMLLSGFLFTRESMPQLFQWLGELIPLTYYLQILRGIILKGVPFAVLWTQTLTLSVFAAAVLAVAISQFRKRVD